MRAAVLYDVDDIRIEERAIPELREGDILVRTVASGICSGDVMPWYIRRKAPLVLGHEPAASSRRSRGERWPFRRAATACSCTTTRPALRAALRARRVRAMCDLARDQDRSRRHRRVLSRRVAKISAIRSCFAGGGRFRGRIARRAARLRCEVAAA